MGRVMFSKSLIQFSVYQWGCVPSLLFDLKPNYGGGNEDMVTSFKISHASTVALSAPDPIAGQQWSMPSLETPGHSQASLFSLLWGHFFLLDPDEHKVLFVPSKSLFPQSCVSSGGSIVVNGDLLQKGLCHTQVCCTQSPCPCPCPCGRLLLTCTFAGDIQTQLWLSLCRIFGSWCTCGLFEPSECLWWVGCLILNTISPLLLSFWGFSLTLAHGVSFFFGGI